jgi:hypothetical protein
MSAPPGSNPKLNSYIMCGGIAGLVVLCGGLLTSSLITLSIVTRHAAFAFSTQRRSDFETQRERERDTRPEIGTGSIDDEERNQQLASQVAQAFMLDLKERRFDKAWSRGSSLFKKDENAKSFRERLEADKVFRQQSGYNVVRDEAATKQSLVRYIVAYRGPGGDSRYVLDVRREEDAWLIDSFAREKE